MRVIREAASGRAVLMAALAIVLHSTLALAASDGVTVSLPGEAPAGAPFDATAVLDPGVDAVAVELLYRSAVTPEIRAVVMLSTGPRQYRSTVPAEHVVSPGVEIVIRLRDRAGQARLHFKSEPDRPYIVTVSGAPAAPTTAPPPSIAKLTPEAGTAVVGRRPTLVVRVGDDAPAPEPGRVTVAIDGVDMTPQLQFAGREVRLRPASALTPGPHQATVTFLDADGQARAPMPWPFTVRDFDAIQEGSLGVGISGTFEYATNKLRAEDPRWKSSANAHIEGRFREGGLEALLRADVRFVDEHPGEPPGVTRAVEVASHLLTLGYGRGLFKGRLELGEIAVRETALTTGPAFARRGGLFSSRLRDTELHLFAVSATPLFGIDNFTGIERSDEMVYGASLSHGILGEALTLKLTALDGRNAPRRGLSDSAAGPAAAPAAGQPTPQQGLQAYNVGSAGGGFDARVYSVALSSRLLDGKLRAEAEGAWARRLLFTAAEFGSEPDERGRQSDGAYRARVEGDAWGLRAGLDYQRVGVDFLSPANPTLVLDREEAGLDLAMPLWLTSWQLRVSRAHDNLRDTRALPRTVEWKFAPSVTLALPHAPSLTVGYVHSDQTTDRPALVQLTPQPERIVTQITTVALTYATPHWFATVAPSYQKQEASSPAHETDTRTVTVAAGITPAPWLNVSPSYTYTRTRDVTVRTDTTTHVPTITARVELVPELVTLDTQTSYVATASRRDTVDSEVFAALARLTVSLKRFFPGGLAPALGVRVNYTKTNDHLSAANRREDYGVFLIFDALASFALLPRPGLDPSLASMAGAPAAVTPIVPLVPTGKPGQPGGGKP